VPDSRSFSDAFWASCVVLLLMAAGCAGVRPEEKEYLAEPAMSWGGEGLAEQHEKHVLDNREGSTGAGSTSGGGCGCN
jgi:Domain of unknown function (DUF4266)